MKKFLNTSSMKRFCESHNIPKNIYTINFVEARYFPLLSKESYVVKYLCDLFFKNTDFETTVALRGNRISKGSADIWHYMYTHNKKNKSHIIPIPLYYFRNEGFMLYREFSGETLRDYDNDFFTLKKISNEIAEKISWWHNVPFKSSFSVRSAGDEKKYWSSVVRKIHRHLPKKNKTRDLFKNLDNIHKKLQSCHDGMKPLIAHGDFQASNILYDKKRNIVGIIDFGATTGFTPVLDIATYMVHLAVMTNKYMSIAKTTYLQKRFLKHYLKNIPEKNKKKIMRELPLYQARVAADIIATTSVALSHTRNPYRRSIPIMLIPLLKDKLRTMDNPTRKINDLMVQLPPYHE